MRKSLLMLLAPLVFIASAFAATVYVYPAVAQISKTDFPIDIFNGMDTPAFATITETNKYIFYAIKDNTGTAYLFRYDKDTGQFLRTIIGTDVTIIEGIDADCGYVIVSYFGPQGPEFKIYTYDLLAVDHEVCLPAKNLFNGETTYGAVVCAPPGKYSPKTVDLVLVSVTTRFIGCAGEWAYYGIGVTGHSTVGTDKYVTVGYTVTRTDSDSQVIAMQPSIIVDGDYTQTLPLFAYIPRNPSDIFNFEKGYVGVYIRDNSSGATEEREYIAKFTETEDVLTTTLDDGSYVISPYYSPAPVVEISGENGPHLVISSMVYDTNSGDVYVFGYDQLDNNVALYRVPVDATTPETVLKVSPFEYNMVFYSMYSEYSNASGEWAMCKSNSEITALFPAREGNENYYYLAKYILGDDAIHIAKKIQIPLDEFPDSTPATLMCKEGKYYVFTTSRKGQLIGPSMYTLSDFWVYVDPPYFQEPPGSTIQTNIRSTVDATLVDVNAPTYITVGAPATVSTTPQQMSFEISSDAPEAEYGVITLTYETQDGTQFKSGVLYFTKQVNDPPTTPQITGVDIESGVATIHWTESVDPDGDPITYMVQVYDETDMTTIYEDNVTTTSVSVPVTIKHTYTVYITATDGNLMSETTTYQFTYTLSMSVALLDPKSGTYIVDTVPGRVSYTTNVEATLYIEISPDGSSWNPIVQETVSGSDTYTTSISLQPGNNYIRARLVYGTDEVVSDIATVYYDNNTSHVITMVEPTDGATYQVAPGAQVEVTFTAAFDTSSDTGTRAYKVFVTDTNGNTYTVASVTTDEQIYTLQGAYGLPAGEYVAYPVYVNPFGSEIYGPAVSFSVVETATPNNPPSTPILYDVQNTTDINVWLQWHASTDPEGDPVTYHVIVATDDMFQNVVLDTKTTDTKLLATNLYGGNTYYWKVQACDSSGLCSSWSPYGSFVVFESTSISIDDPADGAAYVADDTNTATVPVQISALTNTNKQFELNVLYTGGQIDYQILQGPFDQTFEYNITLDPGEYNIVATMKDLETNEVYLTSVHITVYAYGTEAAPIINLIDPSDGYYEEIDPAIGHTTITTRASFELPKEGNNYVAIEYKLKWAATWTTITDANFTVTPDNNKTNLTANVDLTDGVYLFRAKVVDPDGIAWYSETHTVVIRLSHAAPQPPEEGGGGGGGGGGAGGAPILVPEKVVWEVGSKETTIRTVTVNNVGTSPIKVKIWYDGEIAAYILAPPEESTMIIPPGEYNITFKISGKGQPAGTTAEGSIVLAPTGTTIEIPVEIHIVEGTTGPAPGVDLGALAVPIMVIGALAILYLLYTGVI